MCKKMEMISTLLLLFSMYCFADVSSALDSPSDPAKPNIAVTTKPNYVDKATGMEFVFVKGGCYDMGDTFGDGNRCEKPVHKVCVDDFYIGKYAVTQGQWKEVKKNNPSFFRYCGDNCPVENVSWTDIQDYIRTLNQLAGTTYRLPSEAEWEYAARSGGLSEKWAGTSDESNLIDYAWYVKNSDDHTHPVGIKNPNKLGIYDMSGNVWEWVADWFDAGYYKVSPKDNPQGPSTGFRRVLRGGSYNYESQDLRTSNRSCNNLPPVYRISFFGFRLAKTP